MPRIVAQFAQLRTSDGGTVTARWAFDTEHDAEGERIPAQTIFQNDSALQQNCVEVVNTSQLMQPAQFIIYQPDGSPVSTTYQIPPGTSRLKKNVVKDQTGYDGPVFRFEVRSP